jgi:hypothetical protein
MQVLKNFETIRKDEVQPIKAIKQEHWTKGTVST